MKLRKLKQSKVGHPSKTEAPLKKNRNDLQIYEKPKSRQIANDWPRRRTPRLEKINRKGNASLKYGLLN